MSLSLRILLWLATFSIVPLPLEAAPWVHYGGAQTVHVYGAPTALTPSSAPRVADRTAQAAMFEPLYRIDAKNEVQPVLADGPPELKGTRLFVPLKRGVVLHDGRRLTPELAAAAFRAKLGTAAAHVLAPLLGAADGRPAVHSDHERHGLSFELLAPYPAFSRLLASAHSRLGFPSAEAGRMVGTGPMMFMARSKRGALRLVPFTPHREGRPFLDALEIRVTNSRAGATAKLRRGEPHILLEPPDVRLSSVGSAPTTEFPWVLTVLRTDSLELVPVVSRALRRSRLVKRFMGPRAELLERLLPSFASSQTATPSPRSSTRVDLVVSRTDRLGWQFSKRVQLDLLHAGISATLRRVDHSTLIKRLKRPSGALVLAAILPDAPVSDLIEDQFHALLSIAGALESLDTLKPHDLAKFMSASPANRPKRLDELELHLRVRLGLTPIARRPAGISIETKLQAWSYDPHGALVFDNAHYPEANK